MLHFISSALLSIGSTFCITSRLCKVTNIRQTIVIGLSLLLLHSVILLQLASLLSCPRSSYKLARA
jgi:hypothetical protein